MGDGGIGPGPDRWAAACLLGDGGHDAPSFWMMGRVLLGDGACHHGSVASRPLSPHGTTRTARIGSAATNGTELLDYLPRFQGATVTPLVIASGHVRRAHQWAMADSDPARVHVHPFMRTRQDRARVHAHPFRSGSPGVGGDGRRSRSAGPIRPRPEPVAPVGCLWLDTPSMVDWLDIQRA
jgi:hypothetical protein